MGEHLKRRRMDLGLTQREVAQRLDISVQTLANWELVRIEEAAFRHWPSLVSFLGYDPRPAEPSLDIGARIRAARRRLGISQEDLAARLGLDPSTVTAWETGRVRRQWPRIRALFEQFVEEHGF